MAGFIRIRLNKTGNCISISPPDNSVYLHEASCGKTRPHQAAFEADPGKYWEPPRAYLGAAKVDRSGD